MWLLAELDKHGKIWLVTLLGFSTAGAVMFNMLSEPAFAVFPELERWRAGLLGAGAKHVQISGSGSALFCLFNSLGGARSVVGQLSSQLQSRSWVVHGGHY